MDISIVIPAHNEEGNLQSLLNELIPVLEASNYYYEIILVNDNSTDSTPTLIERFASENPSIKVVHRYSNPGKGNALRAGFKEAEGTIIVMLDGDLSHRPGDIPLFIDSINQGAGLVIGSRAIGGSDEYNTIRWFGNNSLTLAFRIMFGLKLKDALNGYKAFRSEVIKKYNYQSSGFEIEIELIANALREGFKIAEVPSHERKRASGNMKSKALRDGSRFLIKIVEEGLKYRIEKYRMT